MTIDGALFPTEGSAGLEPADAAESCHRKDRGVRATDRGQGWVQACLDVARGREKVRIEAAHLKRRCET